jgi:hypothetical protein
VDSFLDGGGMGICWRSIGFEKTITLKLSILYFTSPPNGRTTATLERVLCNLDGVPAAFSGRRSWHAAFFHLF